MPLSFRIVALALPLAAGLLSGCTLVSRTMSEGITSVITPYKVEVVQGNVVTKEMLAQIHTGSSRTDVRDALGSPLLADPFHAERWDYVFTIKRQGTDPQKRSVVIWFDGDTVKSIEAPELPTEEEFVASITRQRSQPLPERKLTLTDEERAALPVPKAPTPTDTAPQGANRSYPPLETP